MKKFLVLILTFIFLFSLVLASCNANNNTTLPDDDDDLPVGLMTTGTSGGTGGTTVSGENLEWTEKTEDVYVYNCQSLAVRKEMNFDDAQNIDIYIKFGTKVQRIKYNSLWSVIMYEGKERYVGTAKLTTDTGSVLFDSKNETVTLVKSWNLRDFTDATGDYNNIRVFAKDNKAGDTYKLTGISKNKMWARFEVTIEETKYTIYGYNYTEYLSEYHVSNTTTTTVVTTTAVPQA